MVNIKLSDEYLKDKYSEGKYFLLIGEKNIRTKQGNNVYVESENLLNKVKEDFELNSIKSKWLNLCSSYVDYLANGEKDAVKTSILQYLNNDLLLYLDDENNEYFEYQKNNYIKYLDKFSKFINTKQRFIPTTGFEKVNIEEETKNKLSKHLDKLSDKQLFAASFFVRISTSAVMTLFLLENEISLSDFYNLVFYSEIDKQKKFSDEEEQKRLDIIFEELSMLEYFLKN